MIDTEFIIWLMFMLIFAILPIKPIIRFVFGFSKDTKPWVEEEEKYGETRYSQLYRPGDRNYNKIAKLSDNAKLINKL